MRSDCQGASRPGRRTQHAAGSVAFVRVQAGAVLSLLAVSPARPMHVGPSPDPAAATLPAMQTATALPTAPACPTPRRASAATLWAAPFRAAGAEPSRARQPERSRLPSHPSRARMPHPKRGCRRSMWKGRASRRFHLHSPCHLIHPEKISTHLHRAAASTARNRTTLPPCQNSKTAPDHCLCSLNE